jgi:hypothetical protein
VKDDDLGLTRALFGEHARRVGAWMYVQDQGGGVVSFVGASRHPDGARPDGSPAAAGAHPLRYGSGRPHQLLVGELIVRPRLAVATSALAGMGLGGLATHDHDLRGMLADGEVLLNQDGITVDPGGKGDDGPHRP